MAEQNQYNQVMSYYTQGDMASPTLQQREPLPVVESGRHYSNKDLSLQSQLVLVGLALLLAALFGVFLLQLTGSQPAALFGGFLVFAVAVVAVALIASGEWSPSIEALFAARTENKRTDAWAEAQADHHTTARAAIAAHERVQLATIKLQQAQIATASTDQWVIESLQNLLEQKNQPSAAPISNHVQAVEDPARIAAVAWLRTCYTGEGYNPDQAHANGALIRVPFSKRGEWKGQPWLTQAMNLVFDSGVVVEQEVNGRTVYRLAHDTGSAALSALRGHRK